jgi:hypothetical protein
MHLRSAFQGYEVVGGGVAATDLARVAEVIRRAGRGQSVAQIHPET